MKLEVRKYRLSGLTPILGSKPGDPDIYTNYIASKAPTAEMGAEEADCLPDDGEKGVTVFLRHPKTDALCLQAHAVLGFLKEAAKVLKGQVGLALPGAKIGQYVFVDPLYIPFTRNGAAILEEDSVYERPLRAETMRGPRVTLASSEQIDDPWELDITVTLLENDGTAKSKPLTFALLEELFVYGTFKGLGQFRNGCYGRFTTERVDG